MSHHANPPSPIRVAFVGSGNMARLHLRSLRRVGTPHIVVGVHDRDAEASRQFSALAKTTSYSALGELLAVAKPHLVHICTSAGSHFAPAREALLAGAHIYVEKPFVETSHEAEELLSLAAARGLLVCAGHQQVRDPAYVALMSRVPDLGDIVQVTSDFTFRPVGPNAERAGPGALAAQLVDVLPHPLYTLVDALERVARDAAPPPPRSRSRRRWRVPRRSTRCSAPTSATGGSRSVCGRGRLLRHCRSAGPAVR